GTSRPVTGTLSMTSPVAPKVESSSSACDFTAAVVTSCSPGVAITLMLSPKPEAAAEPRSMANTLPPPANTLLICVPSDASSGLADVSESMILSMSFPERSKTCIESGRARANPSASLEQTVNPGGAVTFGAPVDEDDLFDVLLERVDDELLERLDD